MDHSFENMSYNFLLNFRKQQLGQRALIMRRSMVVRVTGFDLTKRK